MPAYRIGPVFAAVLVAQVPNQAGDIALGCTRLRKGGLTLRNRWRECTWGAYLPPAVEKALDRSINFT